MESEKIFIQEPFNSLLDGIERGAITNFYGAPGVGKTNICILAAMECIRRGGKVLYLDTEGGLSPERIRQIASGYEKVFDKMMVVEPKTFQEQGVAIKNMENQDFDMIIVDSAVALYRLECAESEKEPMSASKELSRQLSVLSNIARGKKIPVLITAHTFRNWDTNENRVIGGDSITYWSKSIIFIEKTGKTNERKATIVKHRSKPEGKFAKFEIIEKGIRPSGFRIF